MINKNCYMTGQKVENAISGERLPGIEGLSDRVFTAAVILPVDSVLGAELL